MFGFVNLSLTAFSEKFIFVTVAILENPNSTPLCFI
jgi:hypothetical protein